MPTDPVRVALVLDGGAGPAVWMGGVTHEMDRLRRSPTGRAEPASPAWQQLSEAAHCDLVVDLVVATGASGLNGVVLAATIARGGDLPDLRELWLSKARLWRGKLLHPRPAGLTSLLDGDFVQQAVSDAVAAPAEDRDDGDGGQDVTLLVTGTALSGSSTTDAGDGRGPALTPATHRRVFRFRRRAGHRGWDPAVGFTAAPEDDFADRVEELALAARAAAGLPVATAPARETRQLHALDVGGARAGPSWLVGGGVDGSPPEPLLDELRARPRADPGARWVVHVAAGAGPGAATLPDAASPSWDSLPGRLLALGREARLRDDVEALRRAAARSRSFEHRPEQLLDPDAPGAPPDPGAVAGALWGSYLRARAGATAAEFRTRRGDPPGAGRPVTEEQIDAVLAADLSWIPAGLAPSREMDQTECWQWGIGTARRIARWVSRDARGLTGRGVLDTEVRASVARTEAELDALDQVLEAAVAGALAGSSDIVGAPRAADDAVRDSGLTAVLLHLMEAMVEEWSAARGQDLDAAWARLLGVEVLAGSLVRAPDDPPPFLLHLVSSDAPGTLAAVGLDDGPADPAPAGRLYGTRLGPLGGFGPRPQREWDWLWGRLDAAAALADALLARAGVDAATHRGLVAALVDEILEECGTSREALRPGLAGVGTLTTGQLLALARDGNATDLDAVIDDLATMVAGAPLLRRPAGSGRVLAGKARLRGWLLRRLVNVARRWAKGLVRDQVAPPG